MKELERLISTMLADIFTIPTLCAGARDLASTLPHKRVQRAIADYKSHISPDDPNKAMKSYMLDVVAGIRD